MKNILGGEYEDFLKALGNEPVRGVRVNTLKTDVDTVVTESDGTLIPLSYNELGFILTDGDGVGNGAAHHAGMYYVQDPGAMATVSALDVQPGWRVLDTCAAPGGKSTQLAALIGEGGFLHANEFVPKRAKIAVSNLERMGVRNAVVTSLDTAVLGEIYDGYFDLVVCDAPCSGEGMFRKSDEAVSEWSEDNVSACAKRQLEILCNVAGTVKSGGYLLYSTCTYSTEENEDTVSAFLKSHPDFTLAPAKEALACVTADGIGENMRLCRRFYPHRAPGEGQFIALLRKEKTEKTPTILYKDAAKPLNKEELSVVKKFFSECFCVIPEGRLVKHGELIAIVPEHCPIPPRSVFMAGVLVGEVSRGILRPHHQLFSAYGQNMKMRLDLKKGDPRVAKFLRGEELELLGESLDGWCAVSYEGSVIGGGKCSGGRVKNHYPKGLRNK